MSYTDYNADPASEKIVLVEIDANEESIFLNFEPGIWFVTYYVPSATKYFAFGSGAFGFGAFGTSGTADLGNGKQAARIKSFFAGDEWYSETSSLTILRSTDKSFYFDPAESKPYVHFANHDPPNVFSDTRLGVSQGLSTKGAYYDDLYYDARVLSVPQISRNKDPLFFGKISFAGGTVILNNADGHFDTFQADYEIYGSVVRILLGFEDNAYADFKTMYEGYIEHLRLAEERFELDINDKRKRLSRTLPVNVFDATTYPDLSADDVNKPIPLAYGDLRNVPVKCTNPGLSAGPWTFKICDTTFHPIKSIDAVYVWGGTARTSVGWSGTSLTSASFSLTAGVFSANDEVFVDLQGYASGGTLIENGLEVLRDILANHFSYAYTSVFYNTSAWASAEAAAANIGILIEDPTEGWKVIEDISNTLAGNFIIQDDGRFTFRSYDASRPVDQVIAYHELLRDLEVVYDTTEILSSCRVLYNRDWDEEEFQEYLYNATEAVISDKFKAYNERSFETLLTASSSAQSFASAIMAISGDVRPILRALTGMQSIDRELSDMVNVDYRKKNRAFVGVMSCEVIGKTVDLDNMTVELTLRKTG